MLDKSACAKLKIGSDMAARLKKLNLNTLWDLALHLPLRYEDETQTTPIAEARDDMPVLVEGRILKKEVRYIPLSRSSRQLIIALEDEAGDVIELRFLHFYGSLERKLLVGNKIQALGELKRDLFKREMIHPKIRDVKAITKTTLTPVYPINKSMRQNTLRNIIVKALGALDLSDTVPSDTLKRLQLPDLASSLRLLHAPPASIKHTEIKHSRLPALERLKFDEILAQQLLMQLERKRRLALAALPMVSAGSLESKLLELLPFKLTAAQEQCLNEIKNDLARPHPMNRLLQGDVGCGKTVVSALAVLAAVEAGFQAALMAPTEILAEQHFLKFKEWFEPLGVEVARISGSMNKRTKDKVKQQLVSGEIRVVVGTHALFQEGVAFLQLGLVVIDEQHRFGVGQRLKLRNKGQGVHQLMMSATPIPRTLSMGFFANLDISTIFELPPGRKVIQTRLINRQNVEKVYSLVRHVLEKGEQVYWVCPLVDESKHFNLQAANAAYETLREVFAAFSVGLVHGKLKPAEKAELMQKFTTHDIDLLVATTVIEVGVDVPNATLMVIEHAERMGLAQLHQLRGRVGRGGLEGACVLLYSEPMSDVARERLKIIFNHTDGFKIANEDLRIRGPGEVLGMRQSGAALMRLANLDEDSALLEAASKLAPELLADHPDNAMQHLERWGMKPEGFLDV